MVEEHIPCRIFSDGQHALSTHTALRSILTHWAPRTDEEEIIQWIPRNRNREADRLATLARQGHDTVTTHHPTDMHERWQSYTGARKLRILVDASRNTDGETGIGIFVQYLHLDRSGQSFSRYIFPNLCTTHPLHAELLAIFSAIHIVHCWTTGTRRRAEL